MEGLWFVSLVLPAVIAFGVCSNCECNNLFTHLCFHLGRAHVRIHHCPSLSLFVRASGLISSELFVPPVRDCHVCFEPWWQVSCTYVCVRYKYFGSSRRRTSRVNDSVASCVPPITMTGWFSPRGCAGVLVDLQNRGSRSLHARSINNCTRSNLRDSWRYRQKKHNFLQRWKFLLFILPIDSSQRALQFLFMKSSKFEAEFQKPDTLVPRYTVV